MLRGVFINYIGFFVMCFAMLVGSFLKLIITNTALAVFWQNKLNCSCYEFDILKVSE
jgi:hypothetical protein